MSTKQRTTDTDDPTEQFRTTLADVLDERVDDREYLHSSDLTDAVDAGAKKIGRNLKSAADRAGLHAEKWSHNGVSTTWLVEDRDDDQEADR